MRGIAFAILLTVLATGAARADEQPWVVGVSADHKASAQKLLEEGNALFLEKKYADALERYRAAVGEWDHPAIRFNMVRCLIQLDRPVEASDNLKLALKYGAAPLEEAVYSEALAYEKLLANQIAEIVVRCRQPGVKLTLDGKPLAPCPLEETRRVAPGQHQVVGEKPGFLTRTTQVVIVGGKREPVTIDLEPVASATTVIHRWPTWIPWVVFGSGIGVTAIGGLVELKASRDMNDFERSVANNCAGAGCSGEKLASLRQLESSAKLENKVAIGIVTVGAAALVTGGILFYLNRGKTIERMRVDVAPTSGGAAVTLGSRF